MRYVKYIYVLLVSFHLWGFSDMEVNGAHRGSPTSMAGLCERLLKMPVVITNAAWNQCIGELHADIQNEDAEIAFTRLTHLLRLLYHYLMKSPHSNQVQYEVGDDTQVGKLDKIKKIAVKAIIERDTTSEAVVRIMLLEES